MSSTRKKTTSSLQKFQLKQILAPLAAFLLLTAAFRADLWLFIPVTAALLWHQWRLLGVGWALAVFILGFYFNPETQIMTEDLDKVSWGFFFLGGVLIATQKKMSQMLWSVCFLAPAFVLVSLAVFGVRFWWEGMSFAAWMELQLQSQMMSVTQLRDSSSELVGTAFDNFLFPFFRITVLSVAGLSVSTLLVLNIFLKQLLDQAFRLRWRHHSYWRRFSEWRSSEWVLVPLVVGMGLLLVNYFELFDFRMQPMTWLGWNMSLLAVFPVILSGLCFFVWFIPRISLIFALILVVVLFFFVPYALVVAGFADLWFNFRKEIRDFQKNQKEEDDF